MTLTAWRYVLLAAAWLAALISLPLRCCDLNGFLAWRGTVTTGYFLRFLVSLPRLLIHDYFDSTHTPAAMGGHIAPTFEVAALDLAWLAAVLTGLVLFATAPMVIHRVRTVRGMTILRCLVPCLLVLPLSMLLPQGYRYPLPLAGMYLLSLGHVLAAVALALPATLGVQQTAFPISIKE